DVFGALCALTTLSVVVLIPLLCLREAVRTLFSPGWRHVQWFRFGILGVLIFTAAVGFTVAVLRGLTARESPVALGICFLAVLLLTCLVLYTAVEDYLSDLKPRRNRQPGAGDDESPWSEPTSTLLPLCVAADPPTAERRLSRLRWWR